MGYAHQPRTITVNAETSRPSQAVSMPWYYYVLAIIVDITLSIGAVVILIGLFGLFLGLHLDILISGLSTAIGALSLKALLRVWNTIERIAAYTQQMAEKQS